MKFKSKLIRLIEDHIYFKRTDEDTAERIIELFWYEYKKSTSNMKLEIKSNKEKSSN